MERLFWPLQPLWIIFFRNQESYITIEKPSNCKIFSQQTTSQNQPVVNTFRCSVCSKSFCKEKSLKIHFRLHNREKYNSCSVCNKLYTCAEALQRHVENHRKQKSFTCLICNKSLSSVKSQNLKVPHTGSHRKKAFQLFQLFKNIFLHKTPRDPY